MDPRTAEIVTTTERLFDRNGFAATSVDQISAAAGVSTRTLYKHVGSRAGLISSVLEERRRRFFADDPDGVRELFDRLHRWVQVEGARGCLFLRAAGEAGATAASAGVVAAYRRDLVDLVARACSADLGRAAPDHLVDEVLVLFEGATSAASYRGAAAIAAARDLAARALAEAASPHPTDT